MAFYTSRVDDDGNELERRDSGRGAGPLLSCSRTSVNQNSARSHGPKSSVRYVNPAAFIEKSGDTSDLSSMSLESKLKSSLSSEGRSNIVPPLDLHSEENYPTTNDYTYSCRKTVLNPDVAYETWLSAKRKIMSDMAAQRKKLEEQKRKEQEERKRISEEKFQQWVEAKKANVQRSKTCQEQDDNELRAQISEKETRERIEEWERKKRLEDERRRLLKREEEQKRREMEEQRRQMSAEAWNKWLAESSSKPKPVPLNRGIFTLRGTISDIYVNPNEWKSIETQPERK